MFVTQRSQYAVRAVVELARNEKAGPVTSARIAAARHIPARFLDNILAQLKCAGIVESVRGKNGGYVLGRRSKDLSVGEVVRAVQGCIYPDERPPTCPGGSASLLVWERAHRAMTDVFDSTSFEDLVREETAARGAEAIDYVI